MHDDPDPRGPFVDGRISPMLRIARMAPPEACVMMVDVLRLDGVAPGVVVRVVRAMRRQFGSPP
jgi:hypothetical protein